MPLQLQLLGCDRAAHAADGNGSGPGCDGSVGSWPAASRNTSLQELRLSCANWLSDDELAAAAVALPDLRRLSVTGGNNSVDMLRGLSGAGLAAFTACRRLRHIELPCSAVLEGQQLVTHVPQLTSLTSVWLTKSPQVDSSTATELQAAFRAKHGRHLQVDTTVLSM